MSGTSISSGPALRSSQVLSYSVSLFGETTSRLAGVSRAREWVKPLHQRKVDSRSAAANSPPGPRRGQVAARMRAISYSGSE
jgi:hypothetical protein